MSLVFPGVEDVFARFFFPVSMLISDDFPTLERPMNACSGRVGFGQSFIVGAELWNLASRMVGNMDLWSESGMMGCFLRFDVPLCFLGVDVRNPDQDAGLFHIAEMGIARGTEGFHGGSKVHIGIHQWRHVFVALPNHLYQ